MNGGTGLLVHIGIDTVNLKGKGFTVLKKQGGKVKAGEPMVRVDLESLKSAGYNPQTMIVIAEPAKEGELISFIEFGKTVSRGEKLNN